MNLVHTMSRDRCLVVLAVAVIAIVLIGEIAAYGNIYSYESDVSDDGSYRVGTSGAHVYDVISSDNGQYRSVEKLLVYWDAKYGGVSHDVTVEVGARALDENYYISQLTNNLEYLGFRSVEKVDAASLKASLAGDPAGIGLVVLHGALPDTVYTGSPGDAIFSWISSGGTLYWAGEALGKYIGRADGTVDRAPSGYQTLFLGSECLVDMDVSPVPADNRNVGRVYDEISSNGYSDALCLKNNNVLYGVDSTLLDSGRKCLAIGYTDGKASSTALVSDGSGCVCVMGGLFSNYQRMDLATVIAAGIGPDSVLTEAVHGTVSHGAAEGKVSVGSGNVSVFVYLGGDFSVYGRTYLIGGA